MKTKPVSHSTIKVHRVLKFIREERVSQGLTQKKLALIAGTSKSLIGYFERSEAKFTVLNTLSKLLNALGYELCIRRKNDKPTG